MTIDVLYDLHLSLSGAYLGNPWRWYISYCTDTSQVCITGLGVMTFDLLFTYISQNRLDSNYLISAANLGSPSGDLTYVYFLPTSLSQKSLRDKLSRLWWPLACCYNKMFKKTFDYLEKPSPAHTDTVVFLYYKESDSKSHIVFCKVLNLSVVWNFPT